MAIDIIVRILIFIFACLFTKYSDATCTIPGGLQGNWNDVALGDTVTFSTNKLTDYSITIQGDSSYDNLTCISNLNNVYVFRGDKRYLDIGTNKNLPYFLCMKIVRVTDNLYYYHLLSDKSRKTEQLRVYLPTNSGPDPATAPTCDFCTFTDPLQEDECRLLQKTGVSAETINCTDAPLCLPCDKGCSGNFGNTDTPEEEEGGSNVPLIVGSTIGGVAGVSIITGLSVLFYKKLIISKIAVPDTGS